MCAVAILVFLSIAPANLLRAQLVPINVGHANDGGNAFGIAVAGNFAYLANFNDGLRIYDISDPANPVSVGNTNNGLASGVAVSGNSAFVADSADGLRIYDVSNPVNPVSVGNTNNGATALAVTVSRNLAYLANGSDGLRIYDVSNPANPVNLGHTVTNAIGVASSVAVANNVAYLANGSDGLRVYDVSNPANPVNVGSANNAGLALGVAVSGNLLVLANGFDGLRLYDVSSATDPFSIGNAPILTGDAYAVTLFGSFAVLANFDDGLHFYDLTQPANPAFFASTNNGGIARGIAIAGNYAYLANGLDGLRVYFLQPQLTVTNIGTNTVISWPITSTGFVLQQNPGLDPAGWTFVTNAPVGSGGFQQVTIPSSAAGGYFRLLLLPQPSLTIAGASNNVTLSWPGVFPGFVLEQNAGFDAANWAIVTNVPVASAGLDQVTLPASAPNAFFRLAFMQPQLSIAFSSNSITVSWPGYFTGFALQQNSDLTTTNWVFVTNSPIIVGGSNQVTLSPTDNQFFRLISQ